MTIEQPSDGGPAFPGEIDTIMFHPEGKVEPQTIAARQRGMSLRDYFAAHAPPPPVNFCPLECKKTPPLSGLYPYIDEKRRVVLWRWYYADAMIAEREK